MEYMESLMQQRYEAFEKMLEEYFEEFEGFICCCMAAGVPADKIIVTPPKVDSNFDNTVCVTNYVGFDYENRND